jgi:hypothetical protein
MQAHGTKQIVTEHFVLSAILFGLLVSGLTLVITLTATGNLPFTGQSTNDTVQQSVSLTQRGADAAGLGTVRVDDALVARQIGPGEGLTGSVASESTVAIDGPRSAATDNVRLVTGPGEGINTDLTVPFAGKERDRRIVGPGEGINNILVGSVMTGESSEQPVIKGPGEGSVAN